jgi:hypothetical protein
LSFLSRYGETFYMNQSVNGLMNRLFLSGDPVDAASTFGRSFNMTIYLATLLSTLAFVAASMFVPARHRGGAADFLLVGFTCTIASPVAWTHHYSVVLPAFAAMFAWSMRGGGPLGRFTLPLLCVSYVLLGTYIAGFWRLTGSWLNVVQSYPFAGALMALLLLYLWTMRGEPVARTPPAKPRPKPTIAAPRPLAAQPLVN